MIVLEKITSEKRENLIRKAKSFFGSGGIGLDISSEGNCCITFTGGGGYVTVTVKEDQAEKSRIEVETREWDYQAKKFLEIL